jgi:hypothetical protein
MPRLAAHVVALEHPTMLGDWAPADTGPLASCRIGFVGGGRDAKGIHEFLAIVAEVRRRSQGIEFEVVGSVPRHVPEQALSGVRTSTSRLPLDEFVRRLRALTYVVWLGDPTHYRLVASGSLVDTLALGVPVICRAGPLVDALFERFGDIGYKCDSLESLTETVMRVGRGSNSQTYAAHRRAAAAAGRQLAPERAASLIRGLLGLAVDDRTIAGDAAAS